VPRADLPRRAPPTPPAPLPPKGPTPLSVPQEIDQVRERQAESPFFVKFR
jgi:hypothetical protein